MAVEIPVILDKSFLAVFLGDKENRGHLRGYQWSDFSAGQVFVEELIELLSFFQRQGVDTPLLRFETFD